MKATVSSRPSVKMATRKPVKRRQSHYRSSRNLRLLRTDGHSTSRIE